MSTRQLQWRRFTFFDKEVLTENLIAELAPTENDNGSKAEVTCLTSGTDILVIGDSEGTVTVTDAQLVKRSRQKVFQGPVVAVCVTPVGLVVAAGTTKKGDKLAAMICFWESIDLGEPIKKLNTSDLHHSPAVLTCLAVSVDGRYAACGFADGLVVIYSDAAMPKAKGTPPPLVMSPTAKEPSGVAALHFHQMNDMRLFICNEDHDAGDAQGILSYNVTKGGEPLLLDERGCQPSCTAMSLDTHELMVGRRDGVYFYTAEDRGGAAGFDGEKALVGCLAGYVLVASSEAGSQRVSVTVYDVRNKFIAFQMLLPQGQGARLLSCSSDPEGDRNAAYMVISPSTSNGNNQGGQGQMKKSSGATLIRLLERGTPAKLELLYRKNLYPVAIALAHASDYDVDDVMAIYRMYGDHLYKKSDFEGAMTQYEQTVGHVEPGYIIRRFLDAQRIGQLTSYLDKLHSAGYATSEHTTLLLNCYIKQKDDANLDRFIKEGAGGQSPTFDVQTAIRVLKNAGYSDHAAELAKTHEKHDWYLRIQIERPVPNYEGALRYIGGLRREEAEHFLQPHGKALVSHLPEETTGLLMMLCTGKYRSSSTRLGDRDDSQSQDPGKSCPEDFIHLFVDHPEWLRVFLSHVLHEEGHASRTISDALLELLLREWGEASKSNSVEAQAKRKQRESQVMEVLNHPRALYDPDHALVLVQMMDFQQGQLFLFERLGMTSLMLEHYMATDDVSAMVDMCKREGSQAPQIWRSVLGWMVDRAGAGATGQGQGMQPLPPQGAALDRRWEDVRHMLELLRDDQVLPQVEVVEILSRNPSLPLWVVTEYLTAHFSAIGLKTRQLKAELNDLSSSTNEMRGELMTLRRSASVIASAGYAGAELPSALTGVVKEASASSDTMKKRRGVDEQFFKEMEEAQDGFATVASFFCKGHFNL
ncbi:unnamed protein product [Chrysoparadoxa australica]